MLTFDEAFSVLSECVNLEGRSAGFPGLDTELAQRRLGVLDAATSLADLGQLKSLGLHKLRGDRAGRWAITINGRWRLCFPFKGGDAFGVEIVDYHRG